MTTVARVGRSYMRPATKAANDGHPEPQDPPIKTRIDRGVALTVWAVLPIASVALVAAVVIVIKNYVLK